MADLSYIDATQEVKIVGQDSTGNRANYVGADANGNLTTKDYADGPVSPGTAALASALMGGQFNTSLPTLTNGQQSAVQVDSSGRLIISPATQTVTGTVAVTQSTSPWVVSGTVTANAGTGTFAISAASLPLPTGAATSALQTTGNSSLSSIDTKLVQLALNYGVATAALRVAAQIGNASGVADFGAGTTSAQTIRVVLPTDQTAIPASQSGTWNINNISGTISLPTGASTSALQTTGNTSLSTIATALTFAQGSTTSGQTGNLNMGAVTTAAPSYTTGQTSPFSLTTAGALRVDVANATLTATIGVADKTAFTYGTTVQTVIGGVYQDASPALTAGTQGAVRLTANRAQHMNLRDSSGNELLAQKTMANSVPVVIASDQSAIQVVGNVASGAADSGNPVKTGGVYNSTPPTPSTGQRVDLQVNQFGSLSVSPRNLYKNVTGNATTTVKSGSGVLHAISINNATSNGTATIYDNTAGSGTKIMTLTIPSGGVNPVPTALTDLGCEFTTGLTVVTAGSATNDFTFFYR